MKNEKISKIDHCLADFPALHLSPFSSTGMWTGNANNWNWNFGDGDTDECNEPESCSVEYLFADRKNFHLF